MRKVTRLLRKMVPVLVAVLIIFSPLKAASAQSQDVQVRITQVDNSQFPKLTVYVSVTNAAGDPVGVDPKQLQISEDGATMKADATSGAGEIGPLTTLLVVDISGSMRDANKLQGAKEAAKAYIEQMRPGDQAGLMSFNTAVRYVQPVTTDHKALEAAIDSLKAQDDTAMYDALSQGVTILKDIEGRKAVIVLTDGLDNVSKTKLDDVIQAIGPGGLSISTIGMGKQGQSAGNSGLDEAGLHTLADRAGGVYSYANDSQSLQELYGRYEHALQSEYRITYTSPSALRDGANRTLSVNLVGQQGSGSPVSSAQTKYNPGGVLPEVAQKVSWPIFVGLMGGLLVLFLIPLVIGRFGKVTPSQGGKLSKPIGAQKSRIKIK